jgi:hypothetical protein
MAVSKVEICNIGLGMLGADSIRSFEENNKRARMADTFFDFTRDYLLSKFDWPFAKKYMKLQPLAASKDREDPEGWNPYQIPNDCHAPRDLAPKGSKTPWFVMGNVLYCTIPLDDDGASQVYLYYTSAEIDVSKYSRTFNNLLALGLAVKMCPAITQDKALTTALGEQFGVEQVNAWEANANIGNEYREPDERPEFDSFVNPPDGDIDYGDYEFPYRRR